MRLAITCSICSLLLDFALVYFGRGSFGQLAFVFCSVVFVALPAFFVWFVVVVVGCFFQSVWPFHRALLGCTIVAGSTIVSLPIADALNRRDIDQAKTYCELLVPRIDEFRARHGKYPKRLALLGDVPEPPYVLQRNPGSYFGADESRYWFLFSDPAGMMGGWHYDSEARKWTTWD